MSTQNKCKYFFGFRQENLYTTEVPEEMFQQYSVSMWAAVINKTLSRTVREFSLSLELGCFDILCFDRVPTNTNGMKVRRQYVKILFRNLV